MVKVIDHLGFDEVFDGREQKPHPWNVRQSPEAGEQRLPHGSARGVLHQMSLKLSTLQTLGSEPRYWDRSLRRVHDCCEDQGHGHDRWPASLERTPPTRMVTFKPRRKRKERGNDNRLARGMMHRRWALQLIVHSLPDSLPEGSCNSARANKANQRRHSRGPGHPTGKQKREAETVYHCVMHESAGVYSGVQSVRFICISSRFPCRPIHCSLR